LRKQLVGAFAALVAAMLALAACGGGDETTEALTKSEFIAQGDEICASGDKELEAEAEELAEEQNIDPQNPTAEEREELVLDVFVPALQKQADGLSGLGAPAGEEEQVEAIVAALEKAIGEIEEEPELAFSTSGSPLEEASELATEFGFENCGS